LSIGHIESLTSPENESCQLPHNYSIGNWFMHFCRRYSDAIYTCPIESGTGHCIVDKFWLIFRMRRTAGNTALFHALDEIKIFEGSRGILSFY
jgi:hypothetical protein